jgi:hypothetical protein
MRIIVLLDLPGNRNRVAFGNDLGGRSWHGERHNGDSDHAQFHFEHIKLGALALAHHMIPIARAVKKRTLAFALGGKPGAGGMELR